jgi:hypothetical protein
MVRLRWRIRPAPGLRYAGSPVRLLSFVRSGHANERASLGLRHGAQRLAVDYRTCWMVRLPAGKWAKQLGFGTGQIESSKPIRTIQDNHLSIMYRRHVGSGLGRQESERFSGSLGHRAPQAREAEPGVAGLGEFPFRFRWSRAGGPRGSATACNRRRGALGAELHRPRASVLQHGR